MTARTEDRLPLHAVLSALCGLALGAGPHLLHVPLWITGLLVLTGAWRIAAALRRTVLPGLAIRIPLALLGFWGVMFSYHSISGVEAGSALLLVMAALKLLETRTDRDRILLACIGYFLLFAVFLREQSLWSPVWLAAAVIGITATLARTVDTAVPQSFATSLVHSARMFLWALPLAAALFLLFPRIPGPFWSLPASQTAVAGLGEEMRPGDITALGLSDAVAFRVRFAGRAPAPETMYWRGPVLDWFDGRTWRTTPGERRAALPGSMAGPRQSYEITLEPHGRRWLLALDSPVRWSAERAMLTADGQLLAMEPVTDRLAYRADSVLTAEWAATPGPSTLADNLRLPAGSNPRTVALARQLRGTATEPRQFLRAILERFHREAFYYTLTPPALGRNAVDEFMFGTRQGFCEHYASAFAVMARAGGVPARIVLGYQGGESNPFADYWIVREANAHAWVETWFDGAWHRYDPTAAVAPERIASGSTRGMLRAALDGVPAWRDRFALSRIALSWDAVNAAWDRWVLSFGPEAQEDLLRRLGFSSPDLRDLAFLAGFAALACSVALALLLRARRPREADEAARAYERLCRNLARVVRPRGKAEAPETYLRFVARERPDLAAELRELTGLYLSLRYAGAANVARLGEFRRRVRRFRPPGDPPRASAEPPRQQTGSG